MEKRVPIIEQYNKLNDEQLIEEFSSDTPRRALFIGVLASRLPKFKELLFEQAIDDYNRETSFYKFIMISWQVVIAILDYAKDEEIKYEIAIHVKKYWTIEQYSNFVSYIQNDGTLIKYFE